MKATLGWYWLICICRGTQFSAGSVSRDYQMRRGVEHRGWRKRLVKVTHSWTSASPFGFPPASFSAPLSPSEVSSFRRRNVPPQEMLQIKLHSMHWSWERLLNCEDCVAGSFADICGASCVHSFPLWHKKMYHHATTKTPFKMTCCEGCLWTTFLYPACTVLQSVICVTSPRKLTNVPEGGGGGF